MMDALIELAEKGKIQRGRRVAVNYWTEQLHPTVNLDAKIRRVNDLLARL
jgi:hypothetical protein